MGLRLGLILIPVFLFGVTFGLVAFENNSFSQNLFIQNLKEIKSGIPHFGESKKNSQEIEKAENLINHQPQESDKKLNNVLNYIEKKFYSDFSKDKPPFFDSQNIGKLVHEFTNIERIKHGLSPLKFDLEISKIALLHSQDMANREYFSHETPEGLNPSDRASQNGYTCQKMIDLIIYSGIAENIFQGYLFESYYTVNGEITSYDWNTEEEIAQITVDGWMNSEGHRANILTEIFDREGIGVFISEDHKIYVTQNFC